MPFPKRIRTSAFIFPVAIILLTGLILNAMADTPTAIKGYDPVAYFTIAKAVKGDSSFRFQWRGKTWHFSSRENRDRFAAAPEQYAPQYDGYCAWAMAEARKAETDPDIWKIVNGKLYLNCSQSAYEKWSRDISGNIEKADSHWMTLKDPR